jgi:magnesium transporter
MVTLAAFIPIIAGQGANAGAQTLTIIVRSLALGEVSFRNARKAIFREVTLATINGLAVAILAGAVAYLWQGDLWLGVVLAIAMFLTMMVAALSGALVPLILKLLRVDPALASTVVVTTVTDVCGYVFLLGIGSAMINYLT